MGIIRSTDGFLGFWRGEITKPHKHAKLIKLWADDPTLEIEFKHPAETQWGRIYEPTWREHLEYRVKPKLCFQARVEVPRPERLAPSVGTEIYVPYFGTGILVSPVASNVWADTPHDWNLLVQGLVYLTKKDAEARAQAMARLEP